MWLTLKKNKNRSRDFPIPKCSFTCLYSKWTFRDFTKRQLNKLQNVIRRCKNFTWDCFSLSDYFLLPDPRYQKTITANLLFVLILLVASEETHSKEEEQTVNPIRWESVLWSLPGHSFYHRWTLNVSLTDLYVMWDREVWRYPFSQWRDPLQKRCWNAALQLFPGPKVLQVSQSETVWGMTWIIAYNDFQVSKHFWRSYTCYFRGVTCWCVLRKRKLNCQPSLSFFKGLFVLF